MIQEISSQKARLFVQEHPAFVLLDVRTPEEFKDQHLPHAINLDFHSTDFADRLADLSRDATYLIYCRSGGRAKKAMGLMQPLGFYNIYTVVGYLFENPKIL